MMKSSEHSSELPLSDAGNGTLQKTSGDHVPPRFERAVVSHVLQSVLWSEGNHPPLMLGIHGRPGTGKTHMVEIVLEGMGAIPVPVMASELESEAAGEPAKIIRQRYREALQAMEEGKTHCAVLTLNDVDAGLGDWGGMVQTTVNRQHVCSELMDLLDPAKQDPKKRRVPMIATANDFSKLYEPLRRVGRMQGFHWQPTKEELFGVVAGIFGDMKQSDVGKLVSRFPDCPIAFFSHLRSLTRSNVVLQVYDKYGLKHCLTQTISQRVAMINHVANQEPARVEQVIAQGDGLLKTAEFASHLKR